MTEPFDAISQPLPTSIPTAGGSVITGYDDVAIDVTTPGGLKMRMPRRNAPPDVLAALGQAPATGPIAPLAGNEGAPLAALRAPNAMGIDTSSIDRSLVPTPAPAAPAPATGPLDPLPPDPMQQAQAELRALRAAPQFTASGGGVRTTTQRQGLDPAAVQAAAGQQGEVVAARGEQVEAEQLRADAEAESQGEMARIGERLAADLERVKQAGEADAAAEQRRLATDQAKQDQLLKAAATEVDPKRFWNSKSTGGQIMSAIAIGLGAAAQAYGVRDNPALIILERSIANDIAAQESNRADKRAGAAQHSQMMDRVSQLYTTREDRRRAFTLAAREHVAAQVDSLASKTADKTIRAQAQAFSAKIREQNALDAQSFLLKTADQVSTTQQQVPGGAGKSGAAQQADALEQQMYAPYDPESQIPNAAQMTGVPMQAIGGKEDARALNTQLADTQSLLRTVDELRALSREKLSPKASSAAKSLLATAVKQANSADKGGALDLGAVELAKQQLGGDPTAIWRPGGNAALDSFASTLRARARDQLRNRATPVNPDRVPLAQRVRSASGAGGGGSKPPPTTPLVQR